MSEPILSRFDILLVMRDTVSPVVDEQLASFVVKSHARSHPVTQADMLAKAAEAPVEEAEEQQGVLADGTLSQALLRKYIIYAKQRCKPKLSNIGREREKLSRL